MVDQVLSNLCSSIITTNQIRCIVITQWSKYRKTSLDILWVAKETLYICGQNYDDTHRTSLVKLHFKSRCHISLSQGVRCEQVSSEIQITASRLSCRTIVRFHVLSNLTRMSKYRPEHALSAASLISRSGGLLMEIYMSIRHLSMTQHRLYI